MSEVVLLSPFAGWLTPLEEVPDPVFAERMMGDGVAIDPVETILRAPADATVIAIPDTAHAVTLRLANGAQLLIHIGLETVALGGSGFRALSSAGAQVKAGDPLIEVDLDAVARGAASLLTPIIVASDGYSLAVDRISRAVKSGEPIGTVSGEEPAATDVAGETQERAVRIEAAHGLHARPAARIAALLRPFSSEISLTLGNRSANARSTVAMLGLGVRHGDELRVVGRGIDSRAAVDAVAGLIASGLGEAKAIAPPSAPPPPGNGPICAAPGLAIGRVVQLRADDLPVPEDGAGVVQENEQLARALEAVAAGLTDSDPIAAELADAHRALLDDPELLAAAKRQIAQGRSAAFAWRHSCQAAREMVRATGDPLLMERAADLLDLERRVVAVLAGEATSAAPEMPAGSILVAPDLLPSQFLALDKSQVAGICTADGGPTSHVAILAASAGIPMLVAAGPSVLDLADGATAILDADHEQLETEPTPERIAEVQALIASQSERRAAEVHDAQQPCFTADGVRIEVFANLGSVDDARSAVAAGAEGCGLLRTEFLFLDRDSSPDEEEQRRVLAEIAAALGERPMIVRTLDIGADKPAPYLSLLREENPALGLRGIRLGLARPDLLATQLRAIVRGVPPAQCRIMLPMVSDLHELRQARKALDEAQVSIGTDSPIPLGIMVETPAAALMADALAAEADFLSVGTNDLTQYALARDRGNPAVAADADALHPAVLRLIRRAGEGARTHQRWLGVCGGLAANPLASAILIGLGVTELSVPSAAVPTIKATIRRLRVDACIELAEHACAASSAHEVREIALEALK